jgi:hypothetical protein
MLSPSSGLENPYKFVAGFVNRNAGMCKFQVKV